MTDEKSGTRSSVGLLDVATHLPGLLMDLPTILSGVVTGFGARPSAKTSIGKVFQERAARHADKVFINLILTGQSVDIGSYGLAYDSPASIFVASSNIEVRDKNNIKQKVRIRKLAM